MGEKVTPISKNQRKKGNNRDAQREKQRDEFKKRKVERAQSIDSVVFDAKTPEIRCMAEVAQQADFVVRRIRSHAGFAFSYSKGEELLEPVHKAIIDLDKAVQAAAKGIGFRYRIPGLMKKLEASKTVGEAAEVPAPEEAAAPSAKQKKAVKG